jgi:hypothetical protein
MENIQNTNDEKDFNIEANDLLCELNVVLQQRYPSVTSFEGGKITLTFENGKKFVVSVTGI